MTTDAINRLLSMRVDKRSFYRIEYDVPICDNERDGLIHTTIF